jgi:hypothetical protein
MRWVLLMELREFHNALRVLMNIDADEFYAAVYPGKGRYILPTHNQRDDWGKFGSNPHLWFIRANDADAKVIWAIIEERNSK